MALPNWVTGSLFGRAITALPTPGILGGQSTGSVSSVGGLGLCLPPGASRSWRLAAARGLGSLSCGGGSGLVWSWSRLHARLCGEPGLSRRETSPRELYRGVTLSLIYYRVVNTLDEGGLLCRRVLVTVVSLPALTVEKVSQKEPLAKPPSRIQESTPYHPHTCIRRLKKCR